MGGGSSRSRVVHFRNPSGTDTVSPDMLKTVVYLSRKVGDYFEDERDIQELVTFAAANNKALKISGYIIVAKPFFFQRLEGHPHHIDALVQGIKGDLRHDNFFLVQQKLISARAYGSWSMRMINAIKSGVTGFEAVSCMMQMLSRGCIASAKHIPPQFCKQLLMGAELVPTDQQCEMIVVTVSLGASVVPVGDAQGAVNVQLISDVVDHLHLRLCTLNSEGRGMVSLYGGTAIQLAIDWQPLRPNLANKVVRACSQLVARAAPRGEVRCGVARGWVTVKHPVPGGEPWKGRCMYGSPLTAALEAATALHRTPWLLAVGETVAEKLLPEFRTSAVTVGGRPMRAVEVFPAAARGSPRWAAAAAGPAAHSGETAVSRLVSYRPLGDEPEGASGCASDAASEASEVLADLEWMYQLESLSRAHVRQAKRKGRRKSRPLAAPDATAPASPSFCPSSHGSGGSQLLNIIYVSTVAPDCRMSIADVQRLGDRAARRNAELGLTGFLLFTRPFFLQYLEVHPVPFHFTPSAPKTARLSAPFRTQQCGVHMRRKRGRIVEHFWGLWCAKIASVLAPKAL